MISRLDKFAQHREQLKKQSENRFSKKQQNFINDHIERYLQKLQPIFDDEFVNKINLFINNFDLKKFNVDYNVFSNLYSLPLEYNMENLLHNLDDNINNPRIGRKNSVKYVVNFYDESFLQTQGKNVTFNYAKTQNYLQEIWSAYQIYKTENITTKNDAIPESKNLERVDQKVFLNDNSEYNAKIYNIKKNFNSTNATLLKTILKFKIRGRILYTIIPCTLVINALCLGFALLLK